MSLYGPGYCFKRIYIGRFHIIIPDSPSGGKPVPPKLLISAANLKRMISIIVELLVFWLLLKYLQNENITSLGLKPNRTRLLQLLTGFLVPVVFVVLFETGVSVIVKNPHHIHEDTAGLISAFLLVPCENLLALKIFYLGGLLIDFNHQ